MTKSTIKRRINALFLLTIFSLETFIPATSYALTSGPTTPEMSAFEPASTANMVDLFSGDFSYNIPLLDVGGYPVNLAYHSGAGPEEEASWVGMGWSLNPGAINRQLRGLPDDFKGDMITQEDNKKPNITVGGNVNASLKLFGFRLPKIKIGRKKKNLGGSLKVKIGIMHNNYTGYKGMIGIGTAFNTSDQNADASTKGLGMSTDLSAGLGLNVDNQSGVNPYANFEVNYKITTQKERDAAVALEKAEKEHNDAKDNAKSGKTSEVYDFKASASKIANLRNILNHESHSGASFGASSSINFTGFQPPAQVQTPMVSKNFTASLALGITLFGGTVAPGIEGTYSKQELKDQMNAAPGYGFMNSDQARAKEEAVLDYNMEKESPYFKRLPNLGVTVFTPDLYSVTSNAGSMQFRPYLRGTGIFFQPHKHDVDKSVDIGLEPAFGNLFHLGVPLQLNKTNNISGKWTTKNDYLSLGDFKSTDASNPANQAFYFKRVGEKNKQDANYFAAIGNTSPVAVRLDGSFSAWAFGNGKANSAIRTKNGDLSSPEARNVRDKANHSIAYLTAAEASMYALQKQIPNYRENTLPTNTFAIKNYISRTGGYRQGHHISQYIITQDDGQRMVYGNPVYNTTQQEVSFAIPYNATSLQNGIAVYNPGSDNSVNNQNGKDHYYHKSVTPAYTTGHLLTGILSPDYVDVTGNGITDDDLGTAVKFNYSELSDASGNPILYKWRTPFTNQNGNVNTANYNFGYKSITDDDKANYSWGEKELWYMHSIESKTMVAQFYTEDREDGVGVVNENGGKNGSIKLKRLKEIRLYSKADLYANGANAIPIKTVHLEYYDYTLLNQLPNNINGKGKLALKSVWFSYGNNTKGQYNKYNFKYKIPASQNYEDNQNDRWGSYKPKTANPNGLDNIEFPYATQNKTDADNFAGNWQMNEIELPSGAIISVQYESDDYSFVQDKRAAQMCFMTGIGGNGSNSGFTESDKIYVKLPVGCNDADLRTRYFDGLKSLAYKSLVDLDGKGHSEYVSGYADIGSYRIFNPGAGGVGDIVEITVGKINGYNPISKAAWQKLKLDLPRYAYPEYDNLDSENSGFISAIRALGAAFGRFKDLVESFDKRANRKGFGNRADLTRSWVRLNTPIGINATLKGKLGGGHRVKEIRITDQWSTMSGVANAEDGSYGQRYEYTTEATGPSGTETISSGVASYEPVMGGDENPFHEPINYVDKHLFGLPKYFYLERPMGEAYFPGCSVGYSKVTVKNLGSDGSVGANGKSVNEFYTAKDFPTKVDELPIERKQPKLSFLPRLFGAKLTTGVTVSQGYVVENSDMHGKPKAEAVYGRNDNEISSAKYLYKVNNPAAEKLDLNNNVSVVSKSGVIENNALVGMDIDMFTEMNESMMENMGVAVDPSFGVTLFGIIPKFSIRLPLPKPNYEKRLYRGSTTIKLVNRYAILEKTIKTVNGSTSTAENMLWDAETGEVLLSKVNNEFNDNTYTFNYPAHWVYDGMGSSFVNEGVYLAGFNASGGLITTTYNGLLVPGDELVDVATSNRYWVANPNNNGTLYLIDKDGALKSVSGANLKIMRSGRRNLAAASVGTIVTMNNPIAGGTINFSQATKILQAKSVNYSQDWPMPVAFNQGVATPYTPSDCQAKGSGTEKTTPAKLVRSKNGVYSIEGSQTGRGGTTTESLSSCNCLCLKAFFDYLINTNQLFITQSQNKTVGQLVALANAAGYNVGTCSVLDMNASKPFYAITTSPTATVYIAQVGDCKISIRSVNSNPVTFSNLLSQPCGTGPIVSYKTGAQTLTKSFPTFCSTTMEWAKDSSIYIPPTNVIYNSDKIVGGGKLTYQASNGWIRLSDIKETNFEIPGLSIIPTNAYISSAKFYLYAHPGGYMPPTYPYATSIPSEQKDAYQGITDMTWFYSLGYPVWNCGQPNNNRTTVGGPFAASGHFDDVILDFYYQTRHAVDSAQYDFMAGEPATGSNSPGTFPKLCYYTFASENYSDPAKRPHLDVTYSIPASSTITATLQIDQCIGSNSCDAPIINPYTKGILGNWRSKKELLYDAKRVNNKGNVSDPTGTHLRNSGYFDSFNPYWQKVGNTWVENLGDPKWQWTTAVNKFNRKGQEVENVDPLGRYSAAQHGYLESVPIAVASNAMYREIGYDGFEDYNFNLGINQGAWDSCAIQDHFNFRPTLGAAAALDNSKAHSGKYSLKLTGNAVMEKPMLLTEPTSIYGIVGNQYKITDGYLRFGFMPVPSKKYIISGWVYDGQPRSASINGLTLKISGTTYNVNDNATNPIMYSKIHVVEGWKRFEVVFDMPASGKFKLEMSGSNINVDDIRIHPYDAQLKSFAYDASSMRLMADLDENNFATFYEYDDEGTLIRIKKETEKGISTIKETRSSIRRKP